MNTTSADGPPSSFGFAVWPPTPQPPTAGAARGAIAPAPPSAAARPISRRRLPRPSSRPNLPATGFTLLALLVAAVTALSSMCIRDVHPLRHVGLLLGPPATEVGLRRAAVSAEVAIPAFLQCHGRVTAEARRVAADHSKDLLAWRPAWRQTPHAPEESA